MSKRVIAALAALMVLSAAFFGFGADAARADDENILKFKTMVGVPTEYTGAKSPIRGVSGGGLPWKLTAAEGELSQSGELKVEVVGLVFAAGPNLDKNTVANFRAVVSCQTVEGGVAAVKNISTDLFPATTGAAVDGGGNAEIEAKLNLPSPCIAPIIFVTSPTGAWFAATGI